MLRTEAARYGPEQGGDRFASSRGIERRYGVPLIGTSEAGVIAVASLSKARRAIGRPASVLGPKHKDQVMSADLVPIDGVGSFVDGATFGFPSFSGFRMSLDGTQDSVEMPQRASDRGVSVWRSCRGRGFGANLRGTSSDHRTV
jgi:hypothetical protein